MRCSRILVVVAALAVAVTASACMHNDKSSAATSRSERPVAGSRCAGEYRREWQELASRIHAPVYCPAWMVTGLPLELHHPSVSPDRSYQVGFHDPELRSGEWHVVVSGYPGSLRVPRCEAISNNALVPCWLRRSGRKHIGRFDVTVYERGIGHEDAHVIYAWTHHGSLYAVSTHVSPPAPTRAQAKRNLDRIMRGLNLIEPGTNGAMGGTHTGSG